MSDSVVCNVALKGMGHYLRGSGARTPAYFASQGGLLDEDGSFSLEFSQFFLLPTYLHQEKALVKPDHRDLFDAAQKMPGESPQVAFLRHFARVEAVWQLREGDEALIEAAPHIWSRQYLDLRFNYQSDKPLLCAALRVWELQRPLRYELRPQDMGCRSWVTMDAPLQSAATPALNDATFAQNLDELSQLFR